MKTVAVISDIHSNIEALTAVLEDIRRQNIHDIYCLGDVIGYGPAPVACLDQAFSVCRFILMGNHEEAVLSEAFSFNAAAKQAVDWTRLQVKPGWLGFFSMKKRWEKLKNLPLSYVEDEMLFVHGSPRDPTMEYILKSDTEDLFGDIPEKIREVFNQIEKVCFVGHTHTPGIITEDSRWYSPHDFDAVWDIKNGERIICNIGSVGQPRDRDNRACYVTFNQKKISYHRISYDFSKVRAHIHTIPQLSNRNGDRLEFGN